MAPIKVLNRFFCAFTVTSRRQYPSAGCLTEALNRTRNTSVSNLIIKRDAMTLKTGKACLKGSDISTIKCGERSGLVLGVHLSDLDVDGDYPTLTRTARRFDEKSGGLITYLLRLSKPIPRLGRVKVFHGIDPVYSSIALVGVGDECLSYNPVEQIDEKKEAIRTAAAVGVRALGNVSLPKIFIESFNHAESAAEGASMATWLYQELKSADKRKFIPKLELYDSCDFDGWKIGLHKAAAQNLARHLQETPGNNLTPSIFAQTAIEILSRYGINVKVRMQKWAKLRNLNAFLAVAKGACHPPVFLEILYEGCDPDVCPVVLIGKGVTFNSGGLCLKKCKGMYLQKGDLSGAACVIATFRAIAALKLPINVRGLIPLCANLPGATAYKPGDVLKSYNGSTILVERTDCEGSLMHADMLSYAGVYNPKFILDIGTMTPDTIGALGSAASGCLSNCDSLYEMMRIASIHTGDRIWRLPLWRYFKLYVEDSISSDFTNNTRSNIGGGTCKAAAFLLKFLPNNADWIHLDTYNTFVQKDDDYMYLSRGMSGRPTRNLIEFLAQLSYARLKNQNS